MVAQGLRCAQAVTGTLLDTPPGSNWLFAFRRSRFLQIALKAPGRARGTCFPAHYLSRVVLSGDCDFVKAK